MFRCSHTVFRELKVVSAEVVNYWFDKILADTTCKLPEDGVRTPKDV